MVIHLILRLVIWLLLTADLSPLNIMIGVAIAFLLPHRVSASETLKDWLKVFGQTILAIPQAYLEAFQMIIRPHQQSVITQEQVKPGHSSRLIFWDIFLITFTPKTIVLKYDPRGWYEVHRIKRGKQS
ncbi:MAG: cation:proton antiporter [Cyanobacteria bacterium P01_G01_bin.49]